MKKVQMLFVAASLLATVTSASAGSFHYAGSPKLGQFYVQDHAAGTVPDGRTDQPHAAQMQPKGGIARRDA